MLGINDFPYDAAEFARVRLGFVPDAVQAEVLAVSVRQGLLCCTRQWGKTTVAAIKALHHAWHHEGALVLVSSPSARQSAIFLRKVREFARRLGVPRRGDGDNAISLALPYGSRIVGLPGVEGTTRGFSNPGMLLIDEAARVPDEMYESLVPSLATGDGALWLLSTPAGKRGFFWREWQSGGAEWKRISVTAPECPRISRRFLERERRRKSERIYRQEYLCEFLDAEGALFREEDLEACVDETAPPLWGTAEYGGGVFLGDAAPAALLRSAPRFYVGVDLGQSHDYSAITVVERDEIVYPERDPVTFAYRSETRFHVRYAERVPLGTAYTCVAEHVRELVARAPLAGSATVIVDGTGVGAPVVDLLRRGQLGCRVMPVSITSGVAEASDAKWFRVPKKDLMGGLQTAFERRLLRVSPLVGAFEELMGELRSMRVRRGERYSGVEHDDLVLALALAWWRARAETGV